MYEFKCVTVLVVRVFIEYESKDFVLGCESIFTVCLKAHLNILLFVALHTVWSVIITPMCFGHKHLLFCNQRTSEK